MRVLAACSLGGAGHLEPLLPFLAAARQRGHDTLVVGPPALADMVGRAGYRFHAGDEPPERAVAPIREQLPVAAPEEAARLANQELFGRLATDTMLPTLDRLCREWRPDLVLRDPCEYASAVAAARHGITVAQVAISLAEVEDGSLRLAAPVLETHRPALMEEVHAAPYLTRFPASCDPSPFPATTRFHEPLRPGRALPADWWDETHGPLVYLTFGTVLGHMSIASDVYRRAARAVAGLGVRVLMTVGSFFDLDKLGVVSRNVHVEPWVDQADVLTEADLVVCHGGSGTAFGAVAAGVPVVTAPMFADQFENSRRIVDAGAGLVVAGGEPAKASARGLLAEDAPAQLARAIQTVLAGPQYRESARRLGLEMAQTSTVDAVVQALLDSSGRDAGDPSRGRG
jgi:UDP:flavonoid glycosyltransferase YjiC (YdhE family)